MAPSWGARERRGDPSRPISAMLEDGACGFPQLSACQFLLSLQGEILSVGVSALTTGSSWPCASSWSRESQVFFLACCAPMCWEKGKSRRSRSFSCSLGLSPSSFTALVEDKTELSVPVCWGQGMLNFMSCDFYSFPPPPSSPSVQCCLRDFMLSSAHGLPSSVPLFWLLS